MAAALKFAFVFLLASVLLESRVEAQCFENEKGRQVTLQAALINLMNMGYDLDYGTITFEDFCKPDSPDCLGNNPTTPYGRYKFDYNSAKLDVPYWQIDSAGAIIFYGCTPPEARYFGLQSYVTISNETLLMSSLGDSVNFKNINYTKTSPSDSVPFDKEMVIVTTGDQTAYADVAEAFVAANVSSINLDVLPNTPSLDIDPFGMKLNNSLFSTLYRIAICANETACNAYQNYTWTVVRIAPHAARDAIPYPLPPLKNRTTGTNENNLETPFKLLVDEVLLRYSKSNTSILFQSKKLSPLQIEGRVCIQEKENCLFDTRDALYIDGDEPLDVGAGQSDDSDNLMIKPDGPSFFLPDEEGNFIVVVGVIHSHTPKPKATYTNIAVYNVLKSMGVGAVLDTDLVGSSSSFLAGRSYFYVWTFARNCTGIENCFTVPTEFPGVPLINKLTFVERLYMDPETNVGPDGAEVIAPTVLHYIPRA